MLPSEFLKKIVPLAQQAQIQTGISAGAIVAQAVLESAWGRSQLSRQYNNLFGVKADKSWTGKTANMMTQEEDEEDGRYNVYAKWRVYPDWESSIMDHNKFFFENPRYKPALAVRDQPEAWCHQLYECGYATDHNYAEELILVMRGRHMEKYDIPKSEWKLLEWASV